jgi:hypothetical protein
MVERGWPAAVARCPRVWWPPLTSSKAKGYTRATMGPYSGLGTR